MVARTLRCTFGLLVGWAMAACGGSATSTLASTPSTSPQEPTITLGHADLYPVPKVAPGEERCVKALSLEETLDAYAFEFTTELPIRPISAGPRIREQPRVGLPRQLSLGELPTGDLKACYRWARIESPDWTGTVSVRLRVDEFGRAKRVEPAAAVPEFPALAGCVSDVVSSVQFGELKPRQADLSIAIQFSRSHVGPPPKNLTQPTGPRSTDARRSACMPVVSAPPIDRLEARLTVDDFDEEQQAAEDKAAHAAALQRRRQGGKRGLEPRPIRRPILLTGFLTDDAPRVAMAEVTKAFESNLGEFQRCYAEAFAKEPALHGRVVFDLAFDAAGSVSRVAISKSEVSAPDLEACLLREVKAVWVDRVEAAEVRVKFPLLLVADPKSEPAPPTTPSVSRVHAYAQELLDAGRVELALRIFGALLQQAGNHPQRCRWHVGAVQAAFGVAPWVDDRVHAAARDLVDHLIEHRDAPETRSCLGEALNVLERLIKDPLERAKAGNGAPHGQEKYFTQLAADRYRELTDRAPFLTTWFEAPPNAQQETR